MFQPQTETVSYTSNVTDAWETDENYRWHVAKHARDEVVRAANENRLRLHRDTISRRVVTVMSDGTIKGMQLSLSRSNPHSTRLTALADIAQSLKTIAAQSRNGFAPVREPAFPLCWQVQWTIKGTYVPTLEEMGVHIGPATYLPESPAG